MVNFTVTLLAILPWESPFLSEQYIQSCGAFSQTADRRRTWLNISLKIMKVMVHNCIFRQTTGECTMIQFVDTVQLLVNFHFKRVKDSTAHVALLLQLSHYNNDRFAVQQGYWKDPYIQLLVKSGQRRAPEINRGMYSTSISFSTNLQYDIARV